MYCSIRASFVNQLFVAYNTASPVSNLSSYIDIVSVNYILQYNNENKYVIILFIIVNNKQFYGLYNNVGAPTFIMLKLCLTGD